jgi:cytochrome c oxidase cbb3-type subunit 3
MVNAPDITRDDLLSKITDDEIASQIKNGKNRMPKFDLPDPVVRGLVARIRSMRGR